MDLINKLPYFYNNGYTKPIIDAEQIERDILVEEIADVLKQMYVSTATWGLDYWEEMLCLAKNTGKTYDDRRSIIYARMRATRTTTVEVVKQLADAFFNSENVIITEYNKNYMFHIEFENAFTRYVGDPINTDIIDDAIVDYAAAGDEEVLVNCSNVEKVIDVYKPAHLNYSFVFSIKNKVEIDSDVKKGYSTLPICNITKAGTWWRSYGEGHLNKSKVIKTKSYTGHSQLAICGMFKIKREYCNGIISEKTQIIRANATSKAIIGKAIIGKATIGGE